MKNLSLPSKIKIKIIRGKLGTFVAEFPEYSIHTEADSLSGLDYMINDLIYAYFNVPKKLWGKVVYIREAEKPTPNVDYKKLLLYQQYVASSCISNFDE